MGPMDLLTIFLKILSVMLQTNMKDIAIEGSQTSSNGIYKNYPSQWTPYCPQLSLRSF